MAGTQIQYRRGSSAQNDAFTGALGEITVDTTNDIIRVHDGSTAGGFSSVSTTATQTLTNKTLTSPNITGLQLGGVAVTATAAELNILDGVTSTASELNILDGVTSTASELNLVDGSVAGTIVNSKAVVYGASGEVNATTLQVGGVSITSTASELNILDGVTSTASELNLVDGSAAGTIVNNKAVVYGAAGQVNATTLQVGGVSITSTAAELNILDGVTSTAAELNLVDGSSAGTIVNSKAVVYGAAGQVNATTLQIAGVSITSTAAELNILDGVTSTAAELNILDGVTSTASEINLLDGATAGTAVNSKAVIYSAASAIDAASITKAGTNGVGNIGASGDTFNTVFAKATSAQYADLAERYVTDNEYEPGTVVVIGGDKEATACNSYADHKVLGIVSTDPAYKMNQSIEGQDIALTGRVPCKVIGLIERGDLLVTSASEGHAEAWDPQNFVPGSIIGKALEAKTDAGPGVIEVAVGKV